MGIKIVTDSTTEIRQEEAKKLGISVVPLKTIFGEVEYLDGIDLTPEEFYIKMANSKELPTTSQPSPFDFEQVFRKELEEGNQIITICLAGSVSGTYQSASIASEISDNIWVIDSGTATLGLQILVKRALQLVETGKTAKEIVDIIEEEKKSVFLFAAIDTLEYLHKGGRLSRTAAFAGTMLNLKPLISFISGEIKSVGKCRSQKNAYAELFKLVESEGGIDYKRPFAIGYTGNRGHFDNFEQKCKQYFESDPIIGSVGSVIGTHAGPGAVVITAFRRNG
jgi:DegV family protein with EDD domain